ncbi:sensor histidine kinase [Arthrobacter sp. YAF34]|uniref:sensor histidine kinase n=1 Tax=Arthrobacter sp. YAF34 TaxID=3233083 RepID=UPI003F903097
MKRIRPAPAIRGGAGKRAIRWPSFRPRGLRQQSTLAAAAVVAATLLIGALLLLVTLESALIAATDGLLRTKVQDVSALIINQDIDEANQAVKDAARKDPKVQILNASGMVIGASEPSLLRAPITTMRPPPGQSETERVTDPALLGNGAEHYVVILGLRDGGDAYWVLAAQTIQPQSETVRAVAFFLAVALPIVLAVVGASVHFLVGRSLRQVDMIREQVSRIDARRLNERVHVPRTHDELETMAVTMNSMLDRIESSDQKQRQFVSDASHELRGPLTSLRAGLEIVGADSSGSSWASLQPILSAEMHRLQRLVDDLLALAKADDEGISLHSQDVDLDDVLAVELRRLHAVSKHQIVGNLVPVKTVGDPGRLGQAFRNVLDNAERHAKSTVVTSMSVADQEIVVTVDNDGPPVPEADREKIFERFVRLDESRSRRRGGSGLGLAIARGIVHAHKGLLTSTETPAGWCRFEFRFPLTASAA